MNIGFLNCTTSEMFSDMLQFFYKMFRTNSGRKVFGRFWQGLP